MWGLTISMLMWWSGLFNEARDWRKGSMAGSESRPQLISIRILTFLSNAAILMASSINGQYLFDYYSTQRGEVKPQSYTVDGNKTVSFVRHSSPYGPIKACGGEVLHDSNINVVFSLWDGGENCLQVLCPGWRTEWWWRGLGWRGDKLENYYKMQSSTKALHP